MNQEKNRKDVHKMLWSYTSAIVQLRRNVQTVKNLVDAANTLRTASAEHVASSILKTKMKQEYIFEKIMELINV